jgi:hypothetical protein
MGLPRSALLIMLAGARNLRWTLEQPTTSLLMMHKACQHVFRVQRVRRLVCASTYARTEALASEIYDGTCLYVT